MIKAPEYTDKAKSNELKINLIFIATNIENNPNIPINTLVVFIDLLFFKSPVKICVNIDAAVSRLVSAEEITADNSPKYINILIYGGRAFAATYKRGEVVAIFKSGYAFDAYTPILAKIKAKGTKTPIDSKIDFLATSSFLAQNTLE